MLPSRYIAVQIDAPYAKAAAYLSDPGNFPQWAEGLGRSFRHIEACDWHADTPMGPMVVRFTPPNDHGVYDHDVMPANGKTMRNPMRLIANQEGCEVVFVLFHRPDQSAAEYEHDAQWVEKDLNRLKAILES